MAFSVSTPQLLIPEGELNEILRIINCNRDPQAKIVGSIFGLWRNSLISPVVQLITGPGKHAEISRKTFGPDSSYHNAVKNYMEETHGLLQLGLWCAGSISRYSRLNPGYSDFDPNAALLHSKGKYAVLLFVDGTQRNLRIQYHIIDSEEPISSRSAYLTAEDILPGDGGFRSLDQVFWKIDSGAKFQVKYNDKEHINRYFSRDMLQSNDQPLRRSITTQPATQPPPQPASQWYESEEGSYLLRKMVNSINTTDGLTAEMSRDTKSEDISLDVNQRIRIYFPPDFPRSGLSISWRNDKARFSRNDPDEICRTIFDRVLNIISHKEDQFSTRI